MAYSIKEYHGKYNRTKRTSKVKYIVVHYVGSGTSAAGSAKNNCIYFSGGNRNASAHYFIDDAYIYEYADPKTYATWHCGDGKGRYGITNQNSIGIEVCINGDKKFTAKEIARLTWLVQKLMADFDVDAENVVMHYDASRKICPKYYAKNSSRRKNQWKALHAKITGGEAEFEPYLVQVKCKVLNVRDEPTTKSKINTTVKKGDVYTIVDESGDWGKLKSGAGWIHLDYTKKL